MNFTNGQQQAHRTAFIEECRQKAWGAQCNADFISTQLDSVIAEITKIKAEDDQLAAEIDVLKSAADHHTKDNRDKRAELFARRNELTHTIMVIGERIKQGQQAMAQLLASVESNLALASHAKDWEWKESEPRSTNDEEETRQ